MLSCTKVSRLIAISHASSRTISYGLKTLGKQIYFPITDYRSGVWQKWGYILTFLTDCITVIFSTLLRPVLLHQTQTADMFLRIWTCSSFTKDTYGILITANFIMTSEKLNDRRRTLYYCSHFAQGCHYSSYQESKSLNKPSAITIWGQNTNYHPKT